MDFSLIKNKQRIFIGGNRGSNEILNIIAHSLSELNKAFDLLQNGEGNLTDAPVVIFNGLDDLDPTKKEARFHAMKPHIALFHVIEEPVPETYGSFEDYINEYERLADNLPKAGTFLYYQSDNVSLMIGKKERDDIQNIEYTKLKNHRGDNQLIIKFESDRTLSFPTKKGFPGELAAAQQIMQRLAIKEKEFIESIENYKPGV